MLIYEELWTCVVLHQRMCRAASLRAGGVGMRYTCIIDGKESHLYYEDNNMWFVEGR
ncbi:MAG: hypothetical protein IJA32_12050 [Lachnospiraceae bacterium]|nr:hypothetical protein [Lachnospiraceae bacterium]